MLPARVNTTAFSRTKFGNSPSRAVPTYRYRRTRGRSSPVDDLRHGEAVNNCISVAQ